MSMQRCCPEAEVYPADLGRSRGLQGARRPGASRSWRPCPGGGRGLRVRLHGRLDLNHSTVSPPKILRDAGLITGVRRGTWGHTRSSPMARAPRDAALAAIVPANVFGVKTVLFVCIRQHARSRDGSRSVRQRHRADVLRAYSAVSAEKLNLIVVRAMAEIGFDLSANETRRLTTRASGRAVRLRGDGLRRGERRSVPDLSHERLSAALELLRSVRVRGR